MDILSIPFHKFVKIEKHSTNDYIFELAERPEYLNHLQTIHACVQLSLAEASSGEFLLQEFIELESEVIPLVRKTEVKYHRPANGTLFARAKLLSTDRTKVVDELIQRRRTIVQIQVEVHDEGKHKILTAVFDWFLKLK